MTTTRISCHCFPPAIISHAVWLFHGFCLSFREVLELLAKRGIHVTNKSVRQCGLKLGPANARRLKRRQGKLCEAWHLDEAVITRSTESTSISGVQSIKMGTPLIL